MVRVRGLSFPSQYFSVLLCLASFDQQRHNKNGQALGLMLNHAVPRASSKFKNPMPFPEIFLSTAASSSALHMLAIFQNSMDEQPMTTRHLKLGQLFSRTRDYLFSVTKNVRFYEWTQDEVETLYSDLLESMQQGQTKIAKGSGRYRFRTTYELNQFIVLRNGGLDSGLDSSSTTGDSSNSNWEIADGQQRLITLCLLMAALRDAVGDPRHPMATEIQDTLVVNSYGQESAYRVVLRQKHNDMLQKILAGDSEIPKGFKNPSSKRNTGDGNNGVDDNSYGDNPVQQLLAQNYWVLRRNIEADAAHDPHFLDNFFAFLLQRVYIYLTIPENQSVARKLIGVSRRGKDTEPIDEFKSMVVFLGIQPQVTAANDGVNGVEENADNSSEYSSESIQDAVLEEWVALQDEMGRDTLEDACLLMAQAELGKRNKRDGETDLLEEFWKHYNDINNDVDDSEESGDQHSPRYDGRQFFDQVLVPGVTLLRKFRKGDLAEQSVVEDTTMKWTFLRHVTSIRSTAQSLEIAVLCTLRYIDPETNPDYLDHVLRVLERVALLFATTSVKVIPRHNRIFGICEAIKNCEYLDKHDLSLSESTKVMEALDSVEFGSTGPKRNVAAAILGRTDAALATHSSDAYIEGSLAVDHILPQSPAEDTSWSVDWTREERLKWQHRLGNLCLLSDNRKNASESKTKGLDFMEKKSLYRQQTELPLTLRVCKFDHWLRQDLEIQHRWILSQCQRCFELKTPVEEPAQ